MLPGIAGIRGFAGAASAPDNLADLFANGEVGDWWRFDVANTDATGSGDEFTIATGIVNGLVLTATGSPEMQTQSGNFAAHMVGDRFVRSFGATIPQPGTIIICVGDSDLSTHVIVTGGSSALRWQISNDSGGNLIAFAGASSFDSTVNEPVASTPKVFALEVNGASSKFRVNGTQTATGNLGTAGTNQITIGSLWDGSFSGTINLYSFLFINRILTSDERDRAERLLGSHAGLTW